MCTVSAIYDYGRGIAQETWNQDMVNEFKKLLEAAKQFDVITGQPDCEDPEKMKWIEVVERNVETQE